jgi:hypothetical protein
VGTGGNVSTAFGAIVPSAVSMWRALTPMLPTYVDFLDEFLSVATEMTMPSFLVPVCLLAELRTGAFDPLRPEDG